MRHQSPICLFDLGPDTPARIGKCEKKSFDYNNLGDAVFGTTLADLGGAALKGQGDRI